MKNYILKIVFLNIFFTFFIVKLNAQNGVGVIDNKGTLKSINKVFASNATPTSNIEGDIWFDTSVATNTVIKIWDSNISGLGGWRNLNSGVHTGITGSIFFAGNDGKPTENNDQLFWNNANNKLLVGVRNSSIPLANRGKVNVFGSVTTTRGFVGQKRSNEITYRFLGDTDTGMSSPNTDELSLSTNGTEAINISDTQTVTINKDLWVKGKFIDSSGDVGLNGQILTSTGTGTDWRYFEKPTIILNRNFNGSNILQGNNNSYNYFPLNGSHILVNNNDFFEVLGNGRIRIKVSGNYLLSAELSTNNMPSGNTKYIVAVFLNGTANPGNIMGYLSRGSVTLSSSDWWGTTGMLMYPLSANDIVHFRYVINNGGNNLRARFLNTSITKL